MVEYVEFPGCDAWPAERVEGLERPAVEHPDSRRAPAGDVQIALRRIGRERRAGHRLAVAAMGRLAPPVDKRLRHKLAVNGEDLHALPAAVGDIHQPVMRDRSEE